MTLRRRTLLQRLPMLALPATTAGLAGCALLPDHLSVDVASFGDWPAGRAPGTCAIERLPSQAARPEAQQALEDALRPALEAAGFRQAASGEAPDVLVQAGARLTRTDRDPWDDPLWWPGGFGVWRQGAWRGSAWGWSARWDLMHPRYERSVALLLRDRASGQPLYEARASFEGYGDDLRSLLAPLFSAALADFPAARPELHRVQVPWRR